MRTNYRVNAGVRFEVFSRDQLAELFNGVLHVMDKIVTGGQGGSP